MSEFESGRIEEPKKTPKEALSKLRAEIEMEQQIKGLTMFLDAIGDAKKKLNAMGIPEIKNVVADDQWKALTALVDRVAKQSMDKEDLLETDYKIEQLLPADKRVQVVLQDLLEAYYEYRKQPVKSHLAPALRAVSIQAAIDMANKKLKGGKGLMERLGVEEKPR